MQPSKRLVIAVVGPTASGKTKLAIELASALDGEVIACDSRTVYKHMDIGTAKPTMQERKGIKHHLLDVVEPDQVYTAATFKKDASAVIEDLFSREKLPIVCGGTGLYSRVLLEGLNIPEVEPDETLRQELSELVRKEGVEALEKLLEKLDPPSLKRIEKGDVFRLIRAIEVSQKLGPFSQVATIKRPDFDVVWIFLNVQNREILREAIVKRLLIQEQDGVIEETKALSQRFGLTQALLNSVPYKEYLSYLDGNLALEQAREEAVKHNYQLARRQIMWFRKSPKSLDQKKLTFYIDESTEAERFSESMREILQETRA